MRSRAAILARHGAARNIKWCRLIRNQQIHEQPNSKEKECFRVFLKIFLEFANFTDCDVGIRDDDELDTAGYFPDFFRAAL